MTAHNTSELVAIHFGHHDVQQHDIDRAHTIVMILPQLIEGGAAVLSHDHVGETAFGQHRAHEIKVIGYVVDRQNAHLPQ